MSKTKEFGYCVIYDDEDLVPDFTFDSNSWNPDIEYLAEDAAEDYYDNHDGYEGDWPVKFAIFDGDKLVGKCEVELGHKPTFSARDIS